MYFPFYITDSRTTAPQTRPEFGKQFIASISTQLIFERMQPDSLKAVHHFKAQPRNHRVQPMAHTTYKARLDPPKDVF